MNKETLEKGKRAYYNYIEKEETVERDIIEYIAKRIEANKDTIGSLIKETKEEIDIGEIKKYCKRKSKYKQNKIMTMSDSGFIKGELVTSKGVLLKEENNPIEVVKSYIDAILSRNALVISDIDYSEISVKNLILEIIKTALKKFETNENLIQILPYEEVNEEEFNEYKENEKIYVYIEDKEFIKKAPNEEIISGEIDEVIEQINENGICKCAIIYTKDKEKAYKFVNRVNGKNVFVNSGIENIEEVEVDEYYIYKNVIYPIR